MLWFMSTSICLFTRGVDIMHQFSPQKSLCFLYVRRYDNPSIMFQVFQVIGFALVFRANSCDIKHHSTRLVLCCHSSMIYYTWLIQCNCTSENPIYCTVKICAVLWSSKSIDSFYVAHCNPDFHSNTVKPWFTVPRFIRTLNFPGLNSLPPPKTSFMCKSI